MEKVNPTLQTRKIEEIHPAEYNPRTIGKDELQRLENSIRTHGIVDPILVNRRTGYRVVGGHQRLKVARKLGWEEIPCLVIDVPEDQEKAINIVLNQRKLMGEYDFSRLADLLQEIDSGAFDVSEATGFVESELEEIANWTPDTHQEEEQAAFHGVLIYCRDKDHQKELLERCEWEGLRAEAVNPVSERLHDHFSPKGQEKGDG